MSFAEDKQTQLKGFQFLANAFDLNHVDQVIPMPSPQGTILAMIIGRFYWERRDYKLARSFIELAYKSWWGSSSIGRHSIRDHAGPLSEFVASR